MKENDLTEKLLDSQDNIYSKKITSNESDENPPGKIYEEVNSKERNLIFIYFLISNILISMDHGSIPASTNELRQLTYYDQGIGLFGSLVYFGNILGSIFVFYFINRYDRKILLIFSLIGNAICLFLFVIQTNMILLLLNRIIVGCLQSFITIYLPVWSNQYGLEPWRNLMIGLIQLVSPVGMFLGYLFASIGISNQLLGGWKLAFIIQSLSIVLLTICFIFVPKSYFSKNIFSFGETIENEKFYINELGTSEISSDDSSLIDKIKVLYKNKVFVYSVLTLSTLIYTATGVQYWMSDYINLILGVTSLKDRLFLFTLVCFTSPTIGVMVGIYLKEKFCKGNIQKSLKYCLVLAIISCGSAIFVPLCNQIFYFILLVWIVLFFGGGLVPVLTSIIINVLPVDLAGNGNSVSNLLTNLIGYLPSPYIYSFLSDILNDKGATGMKVTMWITVFGVLFLAVATNYSLKEKKYGSKRYIEKYK